MTNEVKPTDTLSVETTYGELRIRAVSQAILAFAIVGTSLWLYITHASVPGELIALSGGIIGWYFRGATIGGTNGSKGSTV